MIVEQQTSVKNVVALANKKSTASCNGEYKFAGMRNERPCFQRVDGSAGALFFDGAYWKLSNEGAGSTETQWIYSQMENPSSSMPPLGHWKAEAALGGPTESSYGSLRIKMSAGAGALWPPMADDSASVPPERTPCRPQSSRVTTVLQTRRAGSR